MSRRGVLVGWGRWLSVDSLTLTHRLPVAGVHSTGLWLVYSKVTRPIFTIPQVTPFGAFKTLTFYNPARFSKLLRLCPLFDQKNVIELIRLSLSSAL